MILLDTNVLIYAFDTVSPLCDWSRETIATAVSARGAAIHAVALAEICVGAHAQVMSWKLATADKGRFHTYFPRVQLITP